MNVSPEQREELAGQIIAAFERSEYVEEWPKDERDFFRGNGWNSFMDRREKLLRMRADKVIDAFAAVVRAAQADAWDLGYNACWTGAWNGPAAPNPYREGSK